MERRLRLFGHTLPVLIHPRIIHVLCSRAVLSGEPSTVPQPSGVAPVDLYGIGFVPSTGPPPVQRLPASVQRGNVRKTVVNCIRSWRRPWFDIVDVVRFTDCHEWINERMNETAKLALRMAFHLTLMMIMIDDAEKTAAIIFALFFNPPTSTSVYSL